MTQVPEDEKRCARVLVVDVARPRIAKVISLLQKIEEDDQVNHDDDSVVAVEYIPCVATFDSYEDEHGNNIRYLISVNYHGFDATQKAGSSLAPFFDEDQATHNKNLADADKSDKVKKDLGIIGAALGVGVEDESDVEKIQMFFQTLRGQDREPLPLKVIEPNPEYTTMREETEAFKAFDKDAKEKAAQDRTIGPGKMAKFAFDFSRNIINEILKQNDEVAPDLVSLQEETGEAPENSAISNEKTEEPSTPPPPRVIDPNKMRFACRKCRTILFGEDDFEDPPHVAQQHHFSARKKNHGGAGGLTCQSLFLTDKGLDWMGDMSEMEGRFNCPKCKSKLGTWHWAGAQCSCGTWVTPAVQIPKSKVDELPPITGSATLPPGTVVSPHLINIVGR